MCNFKIIINLIFSVIANQLATRKQENKVHQGTYGHYIGNYMPYAIVRHHKCFNKLTVLLEYISISIATGRVLNTIVHQGMYFDKMIILISYNLVD